MKPPHTESSRPSVVDAYVDGASDMAESTAAVRYSGSKASAYWSYEMHGRLDKLWRKMTRRQREEVRRRLRDRFGDRFD
jgi:hypothetical protein